MTSRQEPPDYRCPYGPFGIASFLAQELAKSVTLLIRRALKIQGVFREYKNTSFLV